MNSFRCQYILLLFLICQQIKLQSQEVYDVFQFASGNSKTFIYNDQYSQDHPAALSNGQVSWQVNASNEQRFFSGISTSAFSLSKRSEVQGFALSIKDYGIEEWRHNSIAFSYGRKLSRIFDLGIQFKGSQLRVKEYGQRTGLNLSISMNMHLNENSRLSLIGHNLNTRDTDNHSSIHLGYQNQFSDKIKMGMELSYHDNGFSDIVGSFYLFYSPIEVVDLSIAYNNITIGPTIGIHYQGIKSFILSLALGRHQRLGSTGSFGMSYSF